MKKKYCPPESEPAHVLLPSHLLDASNEAYDVDYTDPGFNF